MRPELQQLFDRLTEVREAVAAVEDTARPATNGWTTAQVLGHLAKSHDLTVPRFNATLDAARPFEDEDPIRLTFLDDQIIKAMAGRSISIPVPPIFQPGEAGPEAKAACLASIDALMDTIRRADGKVLAGLKVSSPVNERLRLGFYAYLMALVLHARYHANQIPADQIPGGG